MNEIIEYIYEHTKDIALNDMNNKDEISEYYKRYLEKTYSDIEKVIGTTEQKKQIFAELERKMWLKRNTIEKQQILIPDLAFEEIKRLSNIGFLLARKKLYQQNNIKVDDDLVIQDIEKNIEKMKSNYEKVLEYNKEEAMHLVSEGCLDYNYASKTVDITSLRIGEIVEKLKLCKEQLN